MSSPRRHARAAQIALLAFVLLIAGCEVTIEAGVSSDQADTTIALLHNHHLSAIKHERHDRAGGATFDVAVFQREAAQALSVLRAAGTSAATPAAPCDCGSALIPTYAEEQAQLAADAGRELERMIALWDGVISAQVHITPTAGGIRPLGSKAAGPRAALVIKHQPGHAPLVVTVRDLVVHSVQDISADDVVVVLLEGRTPVPSPLVQLGPFTVTQSSADLLRLSLTAMFALLGLCALLIGWTWRRSQRAASSGSG